MQRAEPINPSESQRAAIEAEPRPQLVLAGPGAGKTYCLIERIRYLIEVRGIPAERVCVFTFTNKAAEEVAKRLDAIGDAAQKVNRSTIHRFCVDTLREFGERVNVPVGFGIADDDYQLSLMWRIEPNSRWHKWLLRRFAVHRLRGDELDSNEGRKFESYNAKLKEQNLLDFDQLLTKTAELIQHVPDVGTEIRGRYGAILVDEFQDLNRVQYALVRELARDHRNIFAVGDFDQSIYGWAGADTSVFQAFMNDFGVT
ncbi:MAG: UvrD-helicase domain-containing protein, partial [Gemmatimonadota bacterium]